MKRTLPLLLLLILLLAGCGVNAPAPTPVPTPVPTPEPTPEPTPVPILHFPNGVDAAEDALSVDLSALTASQVDAALPLLRRMSALESVELGEERENAPDWAQIRALEEAAPAARFGYRFTLYGLPVSLEDEELDLNHIEMDDEGELVRAVIACMPHLRWLCMDSCGVSNEAMAAIRDDFPEIDVVWRIWFGACYTVRTDVERILASKSSIGGEMRGRDVEVLKYCTKLRFLDLGHNENIDDISFVRYMPDLEVFIIAMNSLVDLSPLADCPKLEYLELFYTYIENLDALAGLENLRHLNVSDCYYLTDITGVYGLELERFYLGKLTPVPQEQVDEYRRLHPACDVNNELYDGTNGTWRFADALYDDELAPRYALLREQMGYNGEASAYAFYWLDPYY